MNRGDVWLTMVEGKLRPTVVLTRDEVIDLRSAITVAEITTSIRGLHVEVALDHEAVGLDRPCVVNGDGVHTVRRPRLQRFVGVVDDDVLSDVCRAVALAIDCS